MIHGNSLPCSFHCRDPVTAGSRYLWLDKVSDISTILNLKATLL